MNLFYDSSNGTTFDLKVTPICTRSANFHDFTWSPRTVALQYGDKVTRFDKSSVVYDALLDVSGSIADRKTALNNLHQAFEYDIAKMTPGRIRHGGWSIDCYIIVSKTFYKHPYTQNQISIYCPHPFWQKSKLLAWYPEDTPSGSDLGYNYGYDHDYTSLYATESVTVDSPFPAHLKIVITNGSNSKPYRMPGENRSIFVDGVEKININELDQNVFDYTQIEISTRDKTIIAKKSVRYGGDANLFNRRRKTADFFAPLTTGTHTISVPYRNEVYIWVNEERSEPLWT